MEYSFIGNYRLTHARSNDDAGKINWLFLPGGPGIGGEYLRDFVSKLDVPGNLFIGDFPGDGSNRNTKYINYDSWKIGLIETLKKLKPCILVTHSFSGMFTLTIPEIENIVTGLVIISSAPNNQGIIELGKTQKIYNLPNITPAVLHFYNTRTDEALKLLYKATTPYLFAKHELMEGQALLNIIAYNAVTKLWGDQKFHPTYKCKWIPSKIPTIIIGSTDDRLLPIKLFLERKEWIKDNIKMLVLEDTGHFPWLSHFKLINNNLLVKFCNQ